MPFQSKAAIDNHSGAMLFLIVINGTKQQEFVLPQRILDCVG